MGNLIQKKRRNTANNNSEPSMDVSLPNAEWFDEMYGPSTFLDVPSSTAEQSVKKKRVEKPLKNANWTGEIVELSDEEDENLISLQAQVSSRNEIEHLDEFEETTEDDINIITTQNNVNKLYGDQKATTNNTVIGKVIQAPEEMLKIILNRNQLERLAEHLSPGNFHSVVIGCYVCVKVVGLPDKYNDLNFIDRIEKVLEPQTYQHLWFDRRFRLCTLGDIGIGQIVENEIRDDDIHLRHWFSYMEAKDELLPTQEFINTKEKQLLKANLKLERMKNEKNINKINGVQIKRENLEQIALSPTMLQNLAKLDFDYFKKTVINCFVCMPAIRRDKPESCQYHIVRVIDCVRGHRPYKVRNIAEIDYQLNIKIYGKYIINWIKEFPNISDDGFYQWIEDMNLWSDSIPTLDEIRDKAAELQLALNEAAKIPSLQEKEKYKNDEEERNKKSKLPVQSAEDLKLCLLNRHQLQKLVILHDIKLLSEAICGCFVRLKVGSSGKQFQIDQIINVDIQDQKPQAENYNSLFVKDQKEDNRIVVLKYTGVITYADLITAASVFVFTDSEFRHWLQKMHDDLVHPLPTCGFLEKKRLAIKEALKIAAAEEIQENTHKEQPMSQPDGNPKLTDDSHRTEKENDTDKELHDNSNNLTYRNEQPKRVNKRNNFNRSTVSASQSQPFKLRRFLSTEQSVSFFAAPNIEKPINYFGMPSSTTRNKTNSWRRLQSSIHSTPGMELPQMHANSGRGLDQNNPKYLDSLRIDDWRLRQREEILRKELLNIPGIFPPTQRESIDSSFTTNAIANTAHYSTIPSMGSSSQHVSYGLEPINFVRSESDSHRRNYNNQTNGMFFNVATSNNSERNNNSLHIMVQNQGNAILSQNTVSNASRYSSDQSGSSYRIRDHSPQPPPVIRFY